MSTQHVAPEKLDTLLEAALRGALSAGVEILDVYAQDFTVDIKEDNSPLTQADRRAQAAILPVLKAAGALPILSEEAAHAPYAERQDWELLWVVDPLDGTKEFVKRNGEFTVNIALVAEGEPVLGVVYAPFLRSLYWGVVGRGAYKVLDTEPESLGRPDLLRELSERAEPMSPSGRNGDEQSGGDGPLGRPYTVVASRSHMSEETQEFVDELREQHPELQLVSAGSALKICLVADGSADVYPRFAPTMEWDTAAGHAVALAAGCTLTEHPAGTPLRYNKENLLNPWFLVAGPVYNNEQG